MQEVRRLRFPVEHPWFRQQRLKLRPHENEALRKVAGDVRKAKELPFPGDRTKLVPPCFPGWLRSVPGTDLLLHYHLNGIPGSEVETVVLFRVHSDARKLER